MTVARGLVTAGALLAFLCGSAWGAEISANPGNLKEILSSVAAGDTVLLADGVYAGGYTLRRSGTEGAAITLKAAGESCVFDGGNDCLKIEDASWVTVEGIRFQNAERDGIFCAAAPDKPATNVTVRNCVFADNGFPGIMTGHINRLTIENCEAYGSIKSHGIYASNSGDDLIIRNNRSHHNFGNGIHINGDPEMGGDGIISRALVENNVIWENGKRGGAAINMTHVQDSLIRNNLVYNNYAAGITLYYDTGGDACASKRNTVVNNTIYFRAGEGKYALLMRSSATDCRVMNNILVGGAYGAVYVDESCYEGLKMDSNVICTYAGQQLFGDSTEDMAVSVEEWLSAGFDGHSILEKMPEFVDTEKGDLHLRPGSAGIDAGVNIPGDVPVDIDGTKRPQGKAFDIGCYEMPAKQERAAGKQGS